jgi:hypothetical protein
VNFSKHFSSVLLLASDDPPLAAALTVLRMVPRKELRAGAASLSR